MKRLSILLVLCAFLFLNNAQAQSTNLNAQLPVDKNVKIGKLDNGLRYYIRKNSKPENRVEMRLIVNAGSILETDEQQGLAHFLEHMAFNGTKNFEKNELVKYLQSIGIRFGADLNAYTSFDETVYKLTIPSDSTELIDKGFLVLEDWAFHMTLDEEEIDKERGIVIEEWRLGQGPMRRMFDKNIQVIFEGSQYAERLPIGKKEILENFEYSVLKEFYADWYRPNLMAVVVVGDMDMDKAEEKIIEHFSDKKNPENEKERIEFLIPDQKGTAVSIATDKEAPYTMLQVLYKSDSKPQTTEADYLEMVKESCFTGMMNRRYQELMEVADPPFVNAGVVYGNLYSRNKNSLYNYALVSEDGIERGIQTLLTENKRAKTHGFTEGELRRYKLDYLNRMEQYYNERDKTESSIIADEYKRNFLENEPIPGIEFEYLFVKDNIDKITIEDINQLAATLISVDNRVIVVNGPEKENILNYTEENVLAIASDVNKTDIPAYVDNVTGDELMAEKPVSGSIVQEKEIESINAIELKLSNGATVLLKSTDFKNDEIQLTGFAWGGTSLFGEEDHFSALRADAIVNESGIGKFSKSDLTKVLAGKSVYVANTIGTYSQNVSANCRPNEAETMLQLLYLNFTAPRKDEASFQAFISRSKGLFKNLGQEPTNYFYDKYNRIKQQNHPRGSYLPEDSDWDKINYDRALDIYSTLYSNAAEFTFVLVGAFDVDSIKPLIANYIGALPSNSNIRNYNDLGIRPPKGNVSENIYKGSDPKSLALISFNKEIEYNKKDAFLLGQLAQLLNRKYIEVLREEMSGIYGIRTNGSLNKVPYEHASLGISIPCSPDNVDSLVLAAINQIKMIQENGVEKEDIDKARELYKRQKEKSLEQNKYWLNAIKNCYVSDYDFDKIPSYEAMDDITSKNFQAVAKKYINTDEYLKVVLYPEEPKSE